MQTKAACDEIVQALKDAKGQDIRVLDVRELTDFTDYMVIVTGTSSRHVLTLADKVSEHLRSLGRKPAGREGESVGDWVLIDFGDVVVHVMRPQVRDFYNLEKLWGDGARTETAAK
jgi:ribosome-associated protein